MKSTQLLVGVLLCTAIACSDKPTAPATQAPQADGTVSWYRGLHVADVTGAPCSLKSAADLASTGAENGMPTQCYRPTETPRKP